MKKIEIEIPDGYEFDKESMSIVKSKRQINYVDLGLPSGTLWANCNVGAEKEEDFGSYFTYKEAISNYNCPKLEQIEELKNFCTWIFVTKNYVSGYMVIGKNGNYIFLPAAGYRYEGGFDDVGSDGYYWSSSLRTDYSNNAYYLYFNSGNTNCTLGRFSFGRNVREVCFK